MERRGCPPNRRCGQQSRIVMVRKVDQRTFATTRGQETKYEEKTTETVETFNCGSRPDRRVTLHGKRSVAPPFSASAPGSSRGSPPDLRRACSASALHNQNGRLNKVDGPVRKQNNEKFNSANHLNKSLLSTPQRRVNNFAILDSGGVITCKASITEPQNSIKEVQTYIPNNTNQRKISHWNMSNNTNSLFSDFERDCLHAHNEFRAKHGAQKLKLNRRLCKMSEEWAKTLASKRRVEHSRNTDVGENIYSVWSSNPNHVVNGRDAVDSWYSEIRDHPFGREPSSMKSGHFTQVVWLETKELGVAMARGNNGDFYVVANYSPPGNFIGSYAQNVPPPLAYS